MGYPSGWWSSYSYGPAKDHEVRPLKKFVVPEDYIHDQTDFIADNVVRLKALKDDQDDLDSIILRIAGGTEEWTEGS